MRSRPPCPLKRFINFDKIVLDAMKLYFSVNCNVTHRRIRDNRDKLIELGLTTPDEPLDCYQTKEWIEHTAAYDLCKFLCSNVELN